MIGFEDVGDDGGEVETALGKKKILRIYKYANEHKQLNFNTGS